MQHDKRLVLENLKKIVSEAIIHVRGENLPDIKKSKNIYLDYGIDSLEAKEIVLQIEILTGEWIESENMPSLDTVDKIANFLLHSRESN